MVSRRTILSLALPAKMLAEKSGRLWIDGFLRGLHDLSEHHNVPLAGGDTSESPSGFILADIVGSRELRIKRDANSDKALTDLVWTTAKNLGYSGVFVNDPTSIEDDHQSFSARGVRTLDVIDLEIPYWHTAQDTLDKISSKSLAIVGHVFVESVKQLQTK